MAAGTIKKMSAEILISKVLGQIVSAEKSIASAQSAITEAKHSAAKLLCVIRGMERNNGEQPDSYKEILRRDAMKRMQGDGIDSHNAEAFVNWCWTHNGGHWPDGEKIADD